MTFTIHMGNEGGLPAKQKAQATQIKPEKRYNNLFSYIWMLSAEITKCPVP